MMCIDLLSLGSLTKEVQKKKKKSINKQQLYVCKSWVIELQ